MPKMDSGVVRSILHSEKMSALSGASASKLSSEREQAMDYYMGDMPDMVAAEGRSKAVSTDVSDTVDGLMPTLMDIFTSGDEIVKFEPHGPEDVQAAEQETDYVNHVFMQKNPGFVVLYSMIKDALLSKVGIVKVWWEENEREEKETYYDLTDEQFIMIAQDPEVEIVEHTVKDAPGEVDENASSESASAD